MTTILCDRVNGMLGADSFQEHNGGFAIYSGRKIECLPDGRFVAASGAEEMRLLWIEWLIDGMHPKERPVLKDFTGLLLDKNHNLYRYDEACIQQKINEPFYAIGSGCDWAMSAMACQKTLVEALRIACQYNAYSSLPIVVFKIGSGTPDIYFL